MAFPRIEIYPRARPLDGTEDMVVSQGGVLRKASTDQIKTFVDASGGGGGTGTVPVWGSVTGLANGDCVAVDENGLLVKASNNNPAQMPCIGVFKAAVGLNPACIIVAGRETVFSGLNPGVQYFVGLNGGLTTVAPTAPGTVAQRICKGSNTAASAFVQVGEPYTNS